MGEGSQLSAQLLHIAGPIARFVDKKTDALEGPRPRLQSAGMGILSENVVPLVVPLWHHL